MIHENTYKKVDFNGAKGLVFLGDKILTYRRDNKTSNKPLCIDLPNSVKCCQILGIPRSML